MNWFKENKFLTGFFAITLVVAGVLAFLMMSAKSRAAAAQTNYEAAAAKLTSLQTSAPYPDKGNLDKMTEFKKTHQAAIEELQKNLAATQIPLTPVSQSQFQDKLRESVTRVKEGATKNGVKLPGEGKFYMSFDRYETEQPKPEAAAPLLRMLESMEIVVNMLIANGVSDITELKHDPLPEEGGKKETARDSGKPAPKEKEDPNKGLVVRHPFEVTFIAHEGKFHKFINSVVTEKKQFYIPRTVSVKNDKPGGPSRTPQKAATEGAPEGPAIIVGEEKLEVTVKIDVVDFGGAASAKAQPAKSEPAKAEPAKAEPPKEQ